MTTHTIRKALERLSAAAAARDNTMGDACSLLAAKAELADANKAACEAIAAPAAEPWMPIESAPKDGRKIILTYRNANDKPRTVMAVWVTDEEAAENDEDGVGLEAGWYESIDNWDDYSQVAIHAGEPTHWMPLPAAPGAAPPAAPAPVVPEGMCLVTGHDANNYCEIIRLLGLEEEGDPMEAVRQLVESAAPVVSEGDVVVSKDEAGQIVAVTRQDAEGRILSVIAESAAPVVREPLTDAQTDEIWDRFEQAPTMGYRYLVTRAILAAVGIGGGGNG